MLFLLWTLLVFLHDFEVLLNELIELPHPLVVGVVDVLELGALVLEVAVDNFVVVITFEEPLLDQSQVWVLPYHLVHVSSGEVLQDHQSGVVLVEPISLQLPHVPSIL